MPDYPNAMFTMTFLQFYNIVRDDFEAIFADFGTEDEVASLLDVFHGRWDCNEISGETVGEELLFIRNVYSQHHRYYQEVLANYKKEYDYATGNRKVTEFARDGSSNSQGISVELPNKKIDADSIYAYPDSGDKSQVVSSSAGTTIVTDYGAFLDLKREYLRQIRNVYEEFASMFSDCFLHMFF